MNKELARLYDRIHAEELAALAKRTREAFSRAPELAALADERRGVLSAVGAGALSAADGKKALIGISGRERAALLRCGLPGDYLELRFRCARCRDTGYLDELRQKPCACQLTYAARRSAYGAINERETFEAFSEHVYPDETQKKQALRAKSLCETYAEALPRPEKPNLFIMGGNGLGKTYLANAIAHRALSRGVDAHLVTAYRFTQDVLSDIRQNTDNARRCQYAELFVLDDLGSEPVIPNVSNEWLFAVVNERASFARPTIIVTNLGFESLQARYGDRLVSRFVDQSRTNMLRLTGRDLRQMKC